MLVTAFTEYINEHESKRISDFFVAVQDYLENFANGIELNENFDFSFVLVTYYDGGHEIQYIDYQFESTLIQVSSGGSISNKFVGSDTYTNWIYSIGLNGWDEYKDNCDFLTVLDLIGAGAKLKIDNPDEYIDDEEDE